MRRDEILDAIRETAVNNNGKPLGRNRFEQLTGITEYDVGRYWPRWGDAVREAGFEPNALNARLDDHHLLERYIGLVARLGHVPTGAYGFVYLAEGHRGEYKIGRTNLVDRRLGELGAMSAVEYRLIHEIKTDDPSGVESYWHRRFADKRMRGEWFKLTAADVRAFKRWKRLY